MMDSRHRIFAFWTGDNPMPAIRQDCFASFPLTGLEPVLVTPETLRQWIVPGHGLHPAYEYLSPVHRSDYLRPYFMAYHGGGYADLKTQTGCWLPEVERVLRSPILFGAGYRELRGAMPWLQNTVVDGRCFVLSSRVPSFAARLTTDAMRLGYRRMVGNGAFYFKAGTLYARWWLAMVERRLDLLLPRLRERPARGIRDKAEDGTGYPVPWSFLLGDIMSPMSLLFSPLLGRGLPAPSFSHYR